MRAFALCWYSGCFCDCNFISLFKACLTMVGQKAHMKSHVKSKKHGSKIQKIRENLNWVIKGI